MDTRTTTGITSEMVRDALDVDLRPPATSPLKLSRRTFLAVGIASSGVAGAAELGLRDFDGLDIVRGKAPGVAPAHQTFSLRYAKVLWKIDPHCFGPDAELHHQYFPADERYILLFKHARYPGMDLRAGFTATLYRGQGEWKIRINFEEVDEEQEFALDTWISGGTPSEPAYYRGPMRATRAVQIGSAACNFAALRDRFEFTIDAAMVARLSAQAGILLAAHRLDFTLSEVRCEAVNTLVQTRAPQSLPRTTDGPFCNIDMSDLVCRDQEIRLARVGAHLTAFLHVGANPTAVLIGQGFSCDRDAFFVLGGQGGNAVLVLRGGGAAPSGTRIPLRPYAVMGGMNDLRKQLRLAAMVAPGGKYGFGMETAAMAATIGGLDDASQSIELDLGNARLRAIRFHVQLLGAHLIMSDASAARLSVTTPRRMLVHLGDGQSAPSTAVPFTLHLDDDSVFDGPMDNCPLRVRRSADAVDLTFKLSYNNLLVTRASTSIVQRAFPKPGPSQFGPVLVACFSPQHEYSEVFQGMAPPDAAPVPTYTDKTPRPALKAPRRFDDSRPDLARSRLANGSRLAFAFPAAPIGKVRPLTLDSLTDWKALPLIVNRRALPRSAGLEAQLRLTGIDTGTTRDEAGVKVKETVLGKSAAQADPARFTGEPEADETAIEAVYRLIVSPDASARFTTPRGTPDPRHPLVWRAELANEPAVAVRALWARGMQGDFSLGALDRNQSHDGFAGSLDANDRRELVTMTSFYGLAAMRRLIPPETVSPFKKVVRALTESCPTQRLDDDPNGMVFLPAKPYAYLNPNVVCDYPQEGVMVARPFERFAMRLGRAADVDAFWKGEPPAQYEGGQGRPFFRPAFTIERYSHRIVQGRDVYVEVLYKGFLFPIGQRVAYIKVSYPSIQPYLNETDGNPTAYEIQEYYLICNKPVKHFRAYNQPFDSLDFPCQTLILLTTQSPKLSPPVDLLPTKNRPTDRARSGKTFWPTADGSSEVLRFAYRIDGQHEVAQVPLLFIDNAAAHDPATMADIVSFYNALPEAQRTMTHEAAVRRYAAEHALGEASFKTDRWILQARGRLGQADENEHFDMDAFMEGEDQPAFYPVLQKAVVQVESVERLTGRSGQYIDVAFNPSYVRHGFDKAHNPAEIVLDVLTAGIMLNGSDCQGATGGVASMAAELACISRKTGPVGGRRLAAPKPALRAAARQPVQRLTQGIARGAPRVSASVGGDGERTHDASAALAGSFSPFEFLGDAKLLGLIPLKDVCMAAAMASAPKLLEQVEHGVAAVQAEAAQALATMRATLLTALDTVEKAVSLAIDTINGRLQAMHAGLTLRVLYPTLDDALLKVSAAVAQARPDLDHPDLLRLQQRASAIKHAVDALLAALQAIARDPMPSIVTEDLKKLHDIGELIGKSLDGLAQQLAKDIVDAALAKLLAAWCTPERRYLLVAVLGPVAQLHAGESDAAYLRRISALLRNPADALAQLRDALLYESFAKPLVTLLQTVADGNAELQRTLLLSRRQMAATITTVLLRGAQLLPAAAFTGAAEAICGDIEQALLTPKLNVDTLPAQLKTILDKAVDPAKSQLAAAADRAAKEAQARIDQRTPEIQQFLIKEAAKLVTEDERRRYREAMSILGQATQIQTEAAALAKRCQDPATWKTLVIDIKDALRKQFEAAIRERLVELERLARNRGQALLNRAVAMADQALAMLLDWSALRKLKDAGRALEDACAAAAQPLLGAITAWSKDLLPEPDEVRAKLDKLDEALTTASASLATLNLPAGQADAVRDALQGGLATLVCTSGRVRDLCQDASALKAAWTPPPPNEADLCKPENLLPKIQDLYGLRARLDDSFRAAMDAVSACLAAINMTTVRRAPTAGAAEFKRAVTDVADALAELFGDLSGLAKTAANDTQWQKLAMWSNALPSDAAQVKATVVALKATADAFVAETIAQEKVRVALAGYAAADRLLTGALVQMALPQSAFMAEMETAMIAIAKNLASALVTPVDIAATNLGKLDDLVNQGPSGAVLTTILSQDLLGRLQAATIAIASDSKALAKIANEAGSQVLADAATLASDWRQGKCGLRLCASLCAEVLEIIGSGNLMSLFDPQALADLLRQAVTALVPTRISLSYDFDATLTGFPGGNPVFDMDRASYGSSKEALYSEPVPPVNDLVIKTRIGIDLMTGQRTLSAEGRLRPFTINLLGSSLDLISISFAGARFVSEAGSSLKVDTRVSGVRIGAMLEFLSLLQSFFSSSDENGLHYGIEFLPPALVVEYRFCQPFIPIGPMQLLNVGFHVGARLPLDDRQAEFFAMLSSREMPMLIVMLPYGGGGFFGLRANASGIVSFEIQLEFGFVGGLQYGPLSAQARATAGFYLMQAEGQRIFEGFFQAIGEGHLACFGVGVAIEFKMRQESDGTMSGSAQYSYSFKVGFFKVSFHVTTSRSQGNGKGGGAGSKALQLAPAAASMTIQSASAACPPAPSCHDGMTRSLMRSAALDKTTHWRAYHHHFALEEVA